MSSKIELESKFEVSSADFERLLKEAPVARTIQQENVYFDRDWRLAELSATCRLRLSSDHLPALELKLPVAMHEGRRQMLEFSSSLSQAIASWLIHSKGIDVDSEFPPEIATPLLRLGVKQLYRMGRLPNSRYVLRLADGEVELDRAELPSGEHFCEVEIEESDVARHKRLVEWLRARVPSAQPSRLSKFQRLRADLASPTNTSKSGASSAGNGRTGTDGQV